MENENIATMATNVTPSKTYSYHKPSTEGLEKIKTLRKAFTMLDELVKSTAPNSRERSKALTELEDSAMWAIKAVVCNDPESAIES